MPLSKRALGSGHLVALLLALAPAVSAEPGPAATATTATIAAGSTAAAGAAGAEHGAGQGGDLAQGAPVRINDRTVLVIRIARGSVSAAERARAATQALERAFAEGHGADLVVEEKDGVAVIYAGAAPILQLTAADADAAGDASLSVHAAGALAELKGALANERTRTTIATAVFSFSLLVFSGLIAFLALRRLGESVLALRRWAGAHARLPPIRLSGIEVIGPASVRSGLVASLAVGHRLVQFGIVYVWLLIALSLFDATRGYTDRLADLALAPLSALVGSVGAAVPLLVLAAIATVVVGGLVRFAGLFFDSIARGETEVRWISRDLAAPTGVLVRVVIIAAALIFVAPLLGQGTGGVTAWLGLSVLLALALAGVPLLVSLALGVLVVYGRRFQPGDEVEVGGRTGRVRTTTLLEVCLEDAAGAELRVPHVLGLLHPTRISGRVGSVLEVSIGLETSQVRAHALLTDLARSVDPNATVEAAGLDAGGARYFVALSASAHEHRASLLARIADRLGAEGIPLGAAPPRGPAGRP